MLPTLLALTLLAQPEPTLQDLGIKITHDYAAEFAALAPRPAPGDAAWPLYYKAYQQLGCLPEAVADCPVPGEPAWPEARDYIAARQDAVALIREAARRPALGYPVDVVDDPVFQDHPCNPNDPVDPGAQGPRPDHPPMVIDLRLPYLGTMRALTRTLHADAQLAATQNDAQRFADDIAAILSISRHCSDNPIEVADLCSLAICGLALGLIDDALREQPDLLPTASLRPLIDQLATAPMQGHPRPRTTHTRYAILDILQRAWSDDGNGDGKFTSRGIRVLDTLGGKEPELHNSPIAAAMFHDTARRKDTLAEFDRTVSQPQWTQPFWTLERWPTIGPEERDARRAWRGKYVLVGILAPDLAKMLRATTALNQKRDAARAALALELYRREHASFPASLDAIAPTLDNNLPRDHFTGHTLPYTLINGAAHLYSRGPDLDDDNSAPSDAAATPANWQPPKAPRDPADPPPDGDWLLFRIKP